MADTGWQDSNIQGPHPSKPHLPDRPHPDHPQTDQTYGMKLVLDECGFGDEDGLDENGLDENGFG